MIITPVDHPFDWKHPPRLVTGLSLIIVLIFVFWSLADQRREAAMDALYQSRLQAIEWELYETHAGRTGQGAILPTLRAAVAAGDVRTVRRYIGSDDHFVNDVRQNGLSYMPPATYEQWRTARDSLDQERTRVSVQALGIDPEEFRPITFLAYSLVQPDAIHLICVLLLLLSAGTAVELALGSGAVLAAALGGGVVGALTYLVLNGKGVLPMAGGMAAASSIVGLFLMHFRTRKVTWLGSLQLSAALIGVLWLGALVTEFFVGLQRPAELAAQVAALVSGPLWLLIHQRWFTPSDDDEPFPVAEPEEDIDQTYRESLQNALDAVARLDFTEGQKRLREMVKAYPQDVRVLVQLYHIEKLTPASSAYDAVARRLFSMTAGDDSEILKIYRDYLRTSPAQKALDVETSLKLVGRLTRMNEVMEADKLMRKVLEKNRAHPLVAKTAQALADAMERQQESVRARFFRQAASPNT